MGRFQARVFTIAASVAAVLTLAAAAPASAGLVAHWKLDDGSGDTATDSSGNGHHLALSDENTGDSESPDRPTWFNNGLGDVPSGTSAALNYATNENGTADDKAVVSDGWKGVARSGQDRHDQRPRTVSAWVRVPQYHQWNSIAAWGRDRNAGEKWAFRFHRQTGRLRIEIGNGKLVTSNAIPKNEWHHVAVKWEDDGVDDDNNGDGTGELSDATLYIDGQAQSIDGSKSNGAVEVTTIENSDVSVGFDVNARNFVGDIDEVRIYDEALSGSEIEALAVIPEPASLTLLAPAGLLLLRRRAA